MKSISHADYSKKTFLGASKLLRFFIYLSINSKIHFTNQVIHVSRPTRNSGLATALIRKLNKYINLIQVVKWIT